MFLVFMEVGQRFSFVLEERNMGETRWKREAQRKLVKSLNKLLSKYGQERLNRDRGERDIKEAWKKMQQMLHPDMRNTALDGYSLGDAQKLNRMWERYNKRLNNEGDVDSTSGDETPEEEERQETSMTVTPTALKSKDFEFRGECILLTWHSKRFDNAALTWMAFKEWKDCLCLKLHINNWSICIEKHVEMKQDEWVEMKALSDRNHIHAVFEFDHELRLSNLDVFKFKDTKPHVEKQRCRGRQARSSINRQHFYVAGMIKKGSLHRATNYGAWVHYTVYESWINNAWEMNKIDHSEYRRLSTRLRVGSAKRARDVDHVETVEQDKELERASHEIEKALATRRRPFKEYAEVQAFLKQFEQPIFHERFRILIIRGASRMGKSMFAASIRPPCFLDFADNSVSQLPPDFSGYLSSFHKSIVIDNVNSSSYIMAHRSWLQGRNCLAKFARSRCDVHTYSVNLWAVPIIMTMDIDAELVLSNWLVENSIILHLSSPTFMLQED